MGDPYKTVQFALDNTTRDATDGDRFNVKAGSADVLSSKLVLTTYGSPSTAAPCIFQGYTTTALDGGIGDIDGNGSGVFENNSKNAIHVIDMLMHNCGSSRIFRGGFDCLFLRSEFHTTTSLSAALQGATRSTAIDCYVHGFRGTGITTDNGITAWCFIDKSDTTRNEAAIQTSGQGFIHHNIIRLSGSGNIAFGIRVEGSAVFVYNNSIWSNAGSAAGVNIGIANSGHIANNLIEGFSASGGTGITSTSISNGVIIYSNSINDCATALSLGHDEFSPFGGNETLSASPFTDAPNNDFTPVDTGDVLTGYSGQFPGPSGTPATFAARGAVEPECVAAASGGSGRYRGLVPGGGLGAC